MKRLKYYLAALVLVASWSIAHAAKLPGPLVETGWLAKNLDSVVVLDVRKDVKSFTAKPKFKRDKKTGKLKFVAVGGHVPGAVLVDYSKVRVNRKIDGRTVTRLIPEKAKFESLMQSWGVNKNSVVVVMSKGESSGDVTNATRLYWQIKYFGHNNVAVLNGGMAQWIVDRRKFSTAPSAPRAGNWVMVAERKEFLATSDDVAKGMKQGIQLVDTRDLVQYIGTYKKSYVYAKGHIPGAKNFPVDLVTNVSKPARFTSVSDFKKLAAAMNVNTGAETITYCNSGHLATGAWFLMSEVMGNKNVKMYDGSMHQWTLEKRPVTSMKME
jgi:thiosulfate/3-mercaptopyruvate sulfurtransferase